MPYKEIYIASTGTKICLSIWDNKHNCPVIIFIPGTMVHPLFYMVKAQGEKTVFFRRYKTECERLNNICP